METQFSVSFNIKTPAGIENYGIFYVGNERERAYDIFGQLQGDDHIADSNVLFIEFNEREKGIPLNVKMKACTLEQLAVNVKILTKEAFKIYDIEGNSMP